MERPPDSKVQRDWVMGSIVVVIELFPFQQPQFQTQFRVSSFEFQVSSFEFLEN